MPAGGRTRSAKARRLCVIMIIKNAILSQTHGDQMIVHVHVHSIMQYVIYHVHNHNDNISREDAVHGCVIVQKPASASISTTSGS
jgi:hypothetical protein